MARIVLIIPSATYRAQDFVSAAASLGAEVVVASDRRPALATTMGERSIVIDLEAPERAAAAIAAAGAAGRFDAIVGVDDQGVLVAALAAESLGLKHNPPPAVAAARDKIAMRRALEAGGVLQPRWRVARPDDDLIGLLDDVGLPCVIKPATLSASRGVIRADDAEEARAARRRVQAIASNAGAPPDLLLESYVAGREIALEGLLREGRLQVLALFDKPDPLEGPYFEETLYVTPSSLPAALQEAVARRCAQAARALGLREGPIHAEARIAGDDGVMIEIAARSIGGLCSRALRYGMGVDLEELILRHALDLQMPEGRSSAAAAGVMMIPIPRGGTLIGVTGRAEALGVPGIAGVEITIGPGRPLVPLPEGDRYLGFIFATGDSPGAIERSLRSAHDLLEIEIAA